jgi:hypothetical protein
LAGTRSAGTQPGCEDLSILAEPAPDKTLPRTFPGREKVSVSSILYEEASHRSRQDSRVPRRSTLPQGHVRPAIRRQPKNAGEIAVFFGSLPA